MTELTVNQINGKIKRVESQIEGTKKSIAMYQNWIDNPYEWTTECEIKSYKKTIRENEKKINKWEAQLAEFKGMLVGKVKEYPEVRQFVEAWKKACIDHITDPETIKGCMAAWKQMKQLQNKVREEYKTAGKPSYDAYREERDIERHFMHDWGFVYNYLRLSDETIRMEELERDYKYEAERKYNKFIEDAEFYVGEITDTSDLSVGRKGDLNGFVVGKKAKAEVETIPVNGYIKIFHYRTIFKVQK